MLYVSRYVTANNVGICDTDDGSEEVVSMLRLASIVNMNGIAVNGVKMRTKSAATGCQQVIARVDVHQCDMYCTAVQARANLLLHTDIKLWRRMITNIHWRSDEINKPVTVRLSDFGTECAGCILYGNKSIGRHVITIIVDDFIKLSPYTFHPQSRLQSLTTDGIGVKFDLRECSSGVASRLVYDSVMSNAEDYFMACKSIVDNPDRRAAMLQAWGLMSF